MDNEYMQAVEQAKANFDDLQKRGDEALGGAWDELQKELLTPEEIAASNLRVALIGELIKARREKGISRKKLEELSGVKQSIIARMEKGDASLRLETVLRILAPLGKTLAIVPIKPE